MSEKLHNRENFKECIKEATKAPFSGWDFSSLSKYGGNPADPLPWSYIVAINKYIQNSNYMLDMGTGGGEFLSKLSPLPKHTYATEAYKPNVSIAKERLEPLGIKVVEITEGKQEKSPLPFNDEFFDFVINRHEYYEANEIFRILKPQGIFITQQVGYRNNEDLRMIFGSIEPENDFIWNLETAIKHLKHKNFTLLTTKEYIGHNRFYDIRTLVFLLKILTWEFPNFSVDKYENQLYDYYIKLVENGYFDSLSHRFFIIAQKAK
ncbi:MAG: class I SAM-dependent methyltransferase [Promethearchaeota archaeon]